MDTLSHADWLRLHEVTLNLHESPSLSALPGRILAGLSHLFPYDSGAVQDDRGGADGVPWYFGEQAIWQGTALPGSPRGIRVMPAWGPNFLPLRQAWLAVSSEKHPHTSYYRRTGDGSAQRISDLIPMRRLRQSRFFNEISRPLGIVWQMAIYLPLTPGDTLMLAACRRQTDFDARERLMMELLRPHIGTCWRRAIQNEPEPAPAPAGDPAAALRRLGVTHREAEVLRWVCEGKTNREIAIILELSPLTIKLHVERILAKLGCETRTAAARIASKAMEKANDPQSEWPCRLPAHTARRRERATGNRQSPTGPPLPRR